MVSKFLQRALYTPTKGIDLKSSERNMPQDYLSGGSNVRYDENFNLAKRFGFQKIAYGNEVLGGIREFTTTDYKGITKTEIIGFGRFPYRLVKAYSTVSNSTGGVIYLDMRYVAASLRFELTITNATGTVLLSSNLTGQHVDDMVAAIDALANIACVTPASYLPASSSVLAEFSELFDNEALQNGGTRNISWYYWEKIPCSTWGLVAVMNSSMVNATTDTFTYEKHGLVDGDIIRMVGDDGAASTPIPNPLVEGTDYHVVSATRNTFQVSASHGGAAVNLTNTGGPDFWTVRLFGGQPIYHNFDGSEFALPTTASVLSRLYCSTAPEGYSQASLYGNGTDNALSGWDFSDAWYSPRNPFTINQKHICKYDGQTWTRVHAPRLNVGTGVVSGTADVRGVTAPGAPLTGSRAYKHTCVAIDKTGNVTETSLIDGESSVSHVAVPEFRWPAENNTHAGFNDHWAEVNGSQSGVLTVTVDQGVWGSGHTFVAGDVAYFWDNAQLKFISREILSVAATSITLSAAPIQTNDSGGNVTVLDNAIISPNTRIAFWRTKGGTTGDYYLVNELPIVFGLQYGVTGRAFFLDDVPDADLGAVLTKTSETRRFWPPFGNIVANFNNQLCVSGVGDNKSTVFFSDADDIESFPLATNSFNVEADVTALGQSGPSLGVFSKVQTNVVSGDLASFNFRVDKLSENVGCTSRHSIQEVEEGIIFFQTEKGPYMLINGRSLAPVGEHPKYKCSIIEPYFTQRYDTVNSVGAPTPTPRFTHSVSASSGKWNQYILHVPWTTVGYDNYGASGYPSTLVYDYKAKAWCPIWTGYEIEFSGGMCFFQDELFCLDTGATRTLWKQVTTKNEVNYADHSYPILSYFDTAWDSLGNADIYKKYLWITLSPSSNCNSSSWSVRCQSYLNFSDASDHSDFTLSFTMNGPPQEQKLKSGKANAIKFRFTNEDLYEDYSVSGWMYDVALAYGLQSTAWGNQNR